MPVSSSSAAKLRLPVFCTFWNARERPLIAPAVISLRAFPRAFEMTPRSSSCQTRGALMGSDTQWSPSSGRSCPDRGLVLATISLIRPRKRHQRTAGLSGIAAAAWVAQP